MQPCTARSFPSFLSYSSPSNNRTLKRITFFTCRNQLSIRPCYWFSNAALIPPQPYWPQSIICFTFTISTANSITERQFRSVCTTTFAMLRCTNTSPGSKLVISLAGTRLSEQPIHKYSVACCFL